MKFKRAGEFAQALKDGDGFKKMTANWLWTKEDGMEHIAMRLMEFAPGGHTSIHAHAEEHQFYFLKGEAAVVDGEGKETKFAPGDTAYTGPGEVHQVKNVGLTVMKMICMIPILPGADGKTTTSVEGD